MWYRKFTPSIYPNQQIANRLFLTKMAMMKRIEYIPGTIHIFPNYKHQNRKDGFVHE